MISDSGHILGANISMSDTLNLVFLMYKLQWTYFGSTKKRKIFHVSLHSIEKRFCTDKW